MIDNTKKFSGLADVYAKNRPSYSKSCIDYLYSEMGFNKESVIVDTGAGTGIFSKLLLEQGSRVICVEPNADMQRVQKEYLADFEKCEFITSPAEQIPLPDKSVDFITAAQCFHWFDAEAFKKECNRLLGDGGKVVLVWNSRVPDAEIVKEFDILNRRFCSEFKGFKHRGKVDDGHKSFFKNGIVNYKSFPNDYVLNEEKFIGANLSRSSSLREGDVNFDAYIKSLKEFFKKFNTNGNIKMPNVTEIYFGEV